MEHAAGPMMCACLGDSFLLMPGHTLTAPCCILNQLVNSFCYMIMASAAKRERDTYTSERERERGVRWADDNAMMTYGVSEKRLCTQQQSDDCFSAIEDVVDACCVCTVVQTGSSLFFFYAAMEELVEDQCNTHRERRSHAGMLLWLPPNLTSLGSALISPLLLFEPMLLWLSLSRRRRRRVEVTYDCGASALFKKG